MKYKIKQGWEDKTVYTIPPTYVRKEGGRFDLATISQKDMGYLKEVINHEAIDYERDAVQRDANIKK